MKTLVTGAAGFIGSRLAEALQDAGHEVVGVDKLTDYYSPELKRNNFQRVAAAGVETQIRAVQELTASDVAGMDVIFHLAGQPGVTQSWGSSFATYVEENISATAHLLELVRSVSPATRVVLASSSSVYGTAETFPTTESITPKPFSPYGVTKLATEHLAAVYSKNFDLSTVALRYFSVFGPGQRPDMAFSKFFAAAQSGASISVYGDGEQSRDFTFVDDIVAATILAGTMELPAGSVFNLSGGTAATVNEILTSIQQITGLELNFEHVPAKPGDARRTFGDSSAFQLATGWKPKTNLTAGLTAQWNALKAD